MRYLVTALLAASIAVVVAAGSTAQAPTQSASPGFDHEYRTYGALLRSVVREPRVDYQQLKARAAQLQAVQTLFGEVRPEDVAGWTRDHQRRIRTAMFGKHPRNTDYRRQEGHEEQRRDHDGGRELHILRLHTTRGVIRVRLDWLGWAFRFGASQSPEAAALQDRANVVHRTSAA